MTDGPPSAAGPPLSKTAYVVARLRQELTDGLLDPGTPLRQAEIAKRYGVSATPVREALRVLETERVVSFSPNRGATVLDMPPNDVRDVYLLRATLEALATRQAVERAEGPEAFEAVRAIHDRIQESRGDESAAALARLNKDFHRTLFRLGSDLVSEHVELVWKLVPVSATVWNDPTAANTFTCQHERLLEAAESGDADAAEGIAYEHIMTASRFRERASKHPG